MKFRKKPVEIEAELYAIGEPTPQGVEFVMGIELGTSWNGDPDECVAIIRTLEGNMIVSPGDWVITGIDGERYPCKPDIFERTYERSE